MKLCRVCGEEKPLNDFHNSSQTKDGKCPRCKKCDATARRKWSKNNPERSRESSRRRNLLCKYGITVEEYEELLRKQKDVCGICEGKSSDRNLAVDHDHTTGRVRGLLCNNCNRALGLFQDSRDILQKALDYIDI